MKYIIGIDAGGTKTECALISEDLKVVQSIRGEGFNLSVHGIQTGYNVVNDLIAGLNLSPELSSLTMGLCIAAAGAGRQELRISFSELLKNNLHNYSFNRIKVITDAEAALEGAFAGYPGFILIAGTGSILYGKDQKNPLRCGGYGRIIGDEGSGYSIGRKAFRYLSEVLDDIEAGGILSSELISKYNIKYPDDLISFVSNSSNNLADAALLVLDAAVRNDQAALEIIKEEVSGLCILIKGMQNKTKNKSLRIALCGSLIANDNIYSKMFLKKVAADYPDVVITKPEYSPVVGAAISVLKEI